MILTLFLPMLLISLFISGVYWIDAERIDKLSVIAGLLLATYSFQQVFRQQIPVIPDTTLGDKHIYSTIIFVLLGMADGLFDIKDQHDHRLPWFILAAIFPVYV